MRFSAADQPLHSLHPNLYETNNHNHRKDQHSNRLESCLSNWKLVMTSPVLALDDSCDRVYDDSGREVEARVDE